MTALQLELPFILEDPNLRAARAEESFKSYQDKMRKAMYAKLSEEKKRILDLEHRLNVIESAICRGKLEFTVI